MNTELVKQHGGALSVSEAQDEWSPKQLAVLQQIGLERASQAEQAVFLHVCQATGLDPFRREIYGIVRDQYNPDTGRKEPRMTIQTGIDGFRRIAVETGRYEGGRQLFWCDPAGNWRDVWIGDGVPFAGKAVIYRKGAQHPTIAVAHFREYAQTKGNGELTQMWKKMPAGQIGKCAEALALRAAFPRELSNVYIDEEMQQADNPTTVEADAGPAPVTEQMSDQERQIRQTVAEAEKAQDLEALRDLHTVAAHAKLDGAVAAIAAAATRVKKARPVAEEKPAEDAQEPSEAPADEKDAG
jgi:phage recombination protein Bet